MQAVEYGHIDHRHIRLHIGYVDFMLFVYLFLALGSQRKGGFWWNMGLYLHKSAPEWWFSDSTLCRNSTVPSLMSFPTKRFKSCTYYPEEYALSFKTCVHVLRGDHS